jgi:hypothetical protein
MPGAKKIRKKQKKSSEPAGTRVTPIDRQLITFLCQLQDPCSQRYGKIVLSLIPSYLVIHVIETLKMGYGIQGVKFDT